MSVIALMLALAGPPPIPTAEVPQESIVGTWLGSLEVPNGPTLRIGFNISAGDDGTLTTTMDSPDQMQTGLPTGTTTFEEGKLVITAPAFGGRYEGTLQEDGTIQGTWSQGGGQLPLNLEKQEGDGGVAMPPRPQDPVPPFPYRSEDVRYPNAEAGHEMAGTLTLPEGDGPFPAVVLVSGSGPQDRNEELMNHRPFLVIADHFTRNGIAVLRYDDRGVGESGGDFGSATTADLATDAQAAVDYLAGRAEIDAGNIGIVGHSEGGLIAPIVAVEGQGVAFIVMMAGSAVRGTEILYDQGARILAASGVSESEVAKNTERQRRLFAAVESAGADDAFETVRAVMVEEVEKMDATQRAITGFSEGDNSEAIDGAVRQITSPWFRHFLAYDPTPVLERLTTPVLAINGTLDLQVTDDLNLGALEKALEKSGNKDATIRRFEGLNHLFQRATTGAPAEYAAIETTIEPEVLEVMTEWILARARPAA